MKTTIEKSTINHDEPYVVVDRILHKIVYRTTWKRRIHAMRKKDQLDDLYGACRYTLGPVDIRVDYKSI